MRAAIVMATSLVALATSLAVHADEKKTDQKFCAAAASFQSNVAELRAIDPHTTIAEVRALRTRLDNDASQLQSSASKMKTPTAKQFTDAMKQLDKDVNNIPDDATLGQVHAKLQADSQNAQSAGEQLATEAGCPPPSPEQQPAPQGQPQQ